METVKVSGPLFNGTASQAMKDYAEAVNVKLAREVKDEIVTDLNTAFKHSTGHYISKVKVTDNKGSATVDDSGIVYGPWLEGISSKNATTKFAGYHVFERVARKMQVTAATEAEKILPVYLSKMN